MLPSSPTVAAESSEAMDRSLHEPGEDDALWGDQIPHRQLRVRTTKSDVNASSRARNTSESAAHAVSRQVSPHAQKGAGAEARAESKADGVKAEPQQGKAKHESASKGPVDASSTQYTGYGILVDARDAQERWCEAKIIGLDVPRKRVFVHYVGWNARYDTWIAVSFLAAHGSHTVGVDKTTNSWNGKAPLFAPASAARVKRNEAAFHKRKTARSSSSSSSIHKKSLPPPCATSGAKRCARESPVREKEENQERPKSADDDAGGEEVAPVAKRAKRSANSAVKMEVKAEVVSPQVHSKEKKQSKQAKSQHKASELNESSKVHPVGVVVATTDAISERKSCRNREQQNVDIELDVDIQCGESPRLSSSEADDVEQDEEEKPNRAKRRAAPKASKTPTRQSPRPKAVAADEEAITESPSSAVTSGSRSSKQGYNSSNSNATKHDMKKKRTSAKGRSPPPAASSVSRNASSYVDPASALATKEKLAAIFRLRLHQKQMVGGSTPTRSMQEELMHATSSSSPASPAPSTEMDPESVYAREVAAREAYTHYQNAQQLQQYYYQQALLASESMRMQEAAEDANSSDGEAAHELQGGIMDPRTIHARMSALEIQRQQLQQQQLQQYYQQQQQALLSRQRNLQTFASTQAFLEDSGRAWQEQTKLRAASDDSQQEQRQPEAVATSGESGSEPPRSLSEKPQTNASETIEVVAVSDASSASNDSDVSSKEKRTDLTPAAAPADDSGSKSSTSVCAIAQADDRGILYEFVL